MGLYSATMAEDETTITTFTPLAEAVVAKTALESAGIECFLAACCR